MALVIAATRCEAGSRSAGGIKVVATALDVGHRAQAQVAQLSGSEL